MTRRIITSLAGIAFFEVACAGASFVFGFGRVQESLGLYIAAQIFILCFIPTLIYMNKRKKMYYLGNTLTTRGKITIYINTAVALAVIIAWLGIVFPAIIRFTLTHFGTDDVARIQTYELVREGHKGSERYVDSLPLADEININVTYHNHSSKIQVTKDDPAFKQVYDAATQTGDDIPVRYLHWLPSIVLPKTDLSLSDSAN